MSWFSSGKVTEKVIQESIVQGMEAAEKAAAAGGFGDDTKLKEARDKLTFAQDSLRTLSAELKPQNYTSLLYKAVLLENQIAEAERGENPGERKLAKTAVNVTTLVAAKPLSKEMQGEIKPEEEGEQAAIRARADKENAAKKLGMLEKALDTQEKLIFAPKIGSSAETIREIVSNYKVLLRMRDEFEKLARTPESSSRIETAIDRIDHLNEIFETMNALEAIKKEEVNFSPKVLANKNLGELLEVKSKLDEFKEKINKLTSETAKAVYTKKIPEISEEINRQIQEKRKALAPFEAQLSKANDVASLEKAIGDSKFVDLLNIKLTDLSAAELTDQERSVLLFDIGRLLAQAGAAGRNFDISAYSEEDFRSVKTGFKGMWKDLIAGAKDPIQREILIQKALTAADQSYRKDRPQWTQDDIRSFKDKVLEEAPTLSEPKTTETFQAYVLRQTTLMNQGKIANWNQLIDLLNKMPTGFKEDPNQTAMFQTAFVREAVRKYQAANMKGREAITAELLALQQSRQHAKWRNLLSLVQGGIEASIAAAKRETSQLPPPPEGGQV
jgi:hypothetical protein